MSRSMTGTSTYILSKYSRSYPVKRTINRAQNKSQAEPETMSEWQHFTNPVIRLVLDVKSSSSAEMESVRLRIIWKINSDTENGSNNSDVVFEDLDLLSFSVLPSGTIRKQQPEGLPLRAVYRDTVVGLRYLYSREGLNMPVYRRFQISFQSISEASDFIDSIRPVCPCKVNPLNITQGISQPPNLIPAQRPTVRSQVINTSAEKSILPARRSALTYTVVPAMHLNSGQTKFTASAHAPPSSAFALSSSPLNHQPLSDLQSSLRLNVASSPNLSPNFAPVDSICTGQSLPQGPQPAQAHFPNVHNTSMTPIHYISSSLPVASSEQSSGSSGQPPNIAPSLKGSNTQQTASAILASITDVASVYDLPVSSLERLVGDIIREDGFVQLLETLSTMWTTRSVVGTQRTC